MWEFCILRSHREIPDFAATFVRVGITTQKKRTPFIYGVYMCVYEAVSYPGPVCDKDTQVCVCVCVYLSELWTDGNCVTTACTHRQNNVSPGGRACYTVLPFSFLSSEDWFPTRGSVNGWGAILQAGRPWVWVPMRSLIFSIFFKSFQPRYGPGVYSTSNRNEYQKTDSQSVSQSWCLAPSGSHD
jgi:hypothetical protein